MPELSPEVIKELAKIDYDSHRGEMNLRLGYQNDFAHAALKNLMLINGGAIIALLTFIGNDGAVYDKGAMRLAFFLFGSGLISTILSYFGAYFCQAAFMNTNAFQMAEDQHKMVEIKMPVDYSRYDKIGQCILAFACVSALISVLCFAIGSFWALTGLLYVAQ